MTDNPNIEQVRAERDRYRSALLAIRHLGTPFDTPKREHAKAVYALADEALRPQARGWTVVRDEPLA